MFDGTYEVVTAGGGTSTFNVFGGGFQALDVLSTCGSPQVAVMNLHDAVVEGNIFVRSDGVLNMTGGSIGGASTSSSGTVNVSGGSIAGNLRAGGSVHVCGPGMVSLDGGSVGGVVALTDGMLMMSGGSVTQDALASDFGVMLLALATRVRRRQG